MLYRVAIAAFAIVIASAASVFAWGDDGHRIVAYIAAAHLDAPAQRAVAKILGADPSNAGAVADAMAEASTRPDSDFRPRDPSTGRWHFVDLCLQDTEAAIPHRCNGRCVTAKIDEYEERLRTDHYDKWGADGDLAFLIHLVGDIHQPMHAATNADKGGNCVKADSGDGNLHRAWDVTFVEELEDKLHTRSGPDRARRTAAALDSQYQANPPRQHLTWKSGGANDVAWESSMLARDQVYGALTLKPEACDSEIKSCTDAPLDVRSETLEFSPAYVNEAASIAGQQLYIAGMRLASLLNQIWR
ncbi:MAG TPA: S1/P1 nuclease [Candidatus Binataceae bacterium]|nr:S1/P1 nuclease [Candidatus Binataceae bacterium]